MGAYQRMAATKNDLDRCHPENKSELYNLLAHARHQARKQCGCVGISKEKREKVHLKFYT